MKPRLCCDSRSNRVKVCCNQDNQSCNLLYDVGRNVYADASENFVNFTQVSDCHTEIKLYGCDKWSENQNDQCNPAGRIWACKNFHQLSQYITEICEKFLMPCKNTNGENQNKCIDDHPYNRADTFGKNNLCRSYRQCVCQIPLVGKYIFVKTVGKIYIGKQADASNYHDHGKHQQCVDGIQNITAALSHTTAQLQGNTVKNRHQKHDSMHQKEHFGCSFPFIFQQFF